MKLLIYPVEDCDADVELQKGEHWRVACGLHLSRESFNLEVGIDPIDPPKHIDARAAA